jgi:hypothetical protein
MSLKAFFSKPKTHESVVEVHFSVLLNTILRSVPFSSFLTYLNNISSPAVHPILSTCPTYYPALFERLSLPNNIT